MGALPPQYRQALLVGSRQRVSERVRLLGSELLQVPVSDFSDPR